MKYLTNLGEWAKTHIHSVLVILMSFVAPIKPLILAVGMAIIADTVTGLIKANKLKQKVTSHRLSAIISKMLLYQGALITIFVLETFVLGEFVQMLSSIQYLLSKIVACILILVEARSVDENFQIITGFSIFDKGKELLARYKKIKKELDDENEEDAK